MNRFRKPYVSFWQKKQDIADVFRLHIRVMHDALTLEDVAREMGKVLNREELRQLIRELESL